MEQKGQEAPTVGHLDETPAWVKPPGVPLPAQPTVPVNLPLRNLTALAPGHCLASRYTVLGLLGQGGMGVVLAAYDSRLDRRVALKFLHPKEHSERAELKARMVREAQAMARLSHPNVVAVYDASTLEDGSILIAMEMIEGETLRQWCVQAPRTWREILAAHVAAGHGLAAAHAAGLIHRDFKPDNVLVGKGGRVLVTDFGLARIESTSALAPPPAISPSLALADWERALTLPGTFMGTPRYMAPELLQGKPADAQSDVFAFCVTLYESLYGQQPFSGANLAEIIQAQLEGRVNPPPAQSEVPTWVWHAVVHGLQAVPSNRPTSMGELLEVLETDPEVLNQLRRRWMLLALLMVSLAGVATRGWLLAWEPGLECKDLEHKLTDAWDPRIKEQVRQSFLATNLPYAEDSFTRVATQLDKYAEAWVKARVETCEVGQQRAQQTRDLAVLQAYCLERKHSQLRTLTGLLSHHIDREDLPKAVSAAQSLPSLKDCSDAKALMAAIPPPEDPVVRTRMESLQDQVAQLETLNLAGRYREGLALSDELLRQVSQVDYPPLRAQALYQVAMLQEATTDTGAEKLMRQAVFMAAQSRETALEANAWRALVMLMVIRHARYQEAMELQLAVDAAVERTADDQVRGAWANDLGRILYEMGKYDEAKVQFERALSLRKQSLGRDHPDVGYTLSSMAFVIYNLGDYEQARVLCNQALSIEEKTLGPDHPNLSNTLGLLGMILWEMGKFEEAEVLLERTSNILERAHGPGHNAVTLAKLGMVLHALGRDEEAKALNERALHMREKVLGPEHPEIADHLNVLGLVLQGMEQYAQAKALHERALSISERSQNTDPFRLSETLTSLGRALVHLGNFEEANLRFDRARTLLERTFGQAHPKLAEVYLGMGELLLARAKPAEAVPQLERALTMAPGRLRAEAQFALAQALWNSGQDRSRALALAQSAHKHYQDISNGPKLAELSRWLVLHPNSLSSEPSRVRSASRQWH